MRYSGPAFVLYNGRPVLQASSIDFSVETDNKDVNTMLLGRAGHSAGAKSVKLSVSSAVPADGPEVDWVGIADARGGGQAAEHRRRRQRGHLHGRAPGGVAHPVAPAGAV